MAKKISVFFLVITVLFSLTINANATFIRTSFNPPNIFGGAMDIVNSTTANYDLKIYPYNYGGEKTFSTYSDSSNMIIGLWHSIILPDTVYKYSIKLDMKDNGTGNTGTSVENVFQFFSIVNQNQFTGLNANNIGVSQTFQAPAVSPFPADYYSMFWDKTSSMLSVIFCIPESYYNSNVSNFQHCYLVTSLGTDRVTGISNDISLDEYTGVNIQGAYSDVLKEISNKLDMAAGGGLTQEQINEAIQDALNAHDQQLEQEVDGKLEQIMEQINGIVSPYKDAADEINNAFDGLSDVFASSSTASVFKFPEGRMPNGVLLWQEHNIDIGAAWNKLPAKFRSVVQIVCTFTILYIVIQEAVFVIRFIILGRKGTTDD